jgi:rSAM/selenodomain-associated transferase 2
LRAPPTVSIIIPALNEAPLIGALLRNLSSLGAEEIIVADGGSTDRTVAEAERLAKVVRCRANRGEQMNHGARSATSEVLLFLHADVRLNPGALNPLRRAMSDDAVGGGAFDIHYEGGDRASRAFTLISHWRRRFGILYGDSGIFCRRSLFEKLGGFRSYAVLEDYEFSRRLWRQGKMALLSEPIFVSNRRWRHSTLLGTLWSWFWIQGLYLAGVSPARLARMYRNIR